MEIVSKSHCPKVIVQKLSSKSHLQTVVVKQASFIDRAYSYRLSDLSLANCDGYRLQLSTSQQFYIESVTYTLRS